MALFLLIRVNATGTVPILQPLVQILRDEGGVADPLPVVGFSSRRSS